MSHHANCYESATDPLCYADQTLVQRGDYVICFGRNEGRVTAIGRARVWDTLYYDNGTAIGTVLIDADAPKKYIPDFYTFEAGDEESGIKKYFKSDRTLSSTETVRQLYPLFRAGNYLKTWHADTGRVSMQLLPRTEDYPAPKTFDAAFFYQAVLKRAQQNDAACLFAVGFWQREKGEGQQAIRFFQSAAEQDYADAWLELGLEYAEGSILAHNAEKSAMCLQHAAGRGSMLGQYRLALCHIHGWGVEQSDDEAVRWLQAAAASAFAPACYELGLFYAKGTFNHLRVKGSSHRRHNPIREAEPVLAAAMFAEAAGQDWSKTALAKFYLAECYRNGRGLRHDRELALNLYREAVAQGNIEDEEIQAAIYYAGRVDLLRRAADNGHIYAAYLLGRMYWRGEHERDRVAGRRYLRQAAESGHECAADAAQMLLEKQDKSWAFAGKKTS